MTVATDFQRAKRPFELAPKIDDLDPQVNLVKDFTEGRLRLSHPILFSQIDKQTFGDQYFAVAALQSLLTGPGEVGYCSY